MKIKGHSIIELKNVKTGEVERYEDDNIVTNALSHYLKDLGLFAQSPLVKHQDIYNYPIEQLMGGLLLFDSEITANAENIICPSGVKMYGNGAYNVTADGGDGVKELGSWNSYNSGWLPDGKYVMEWDFSQEQANTPQGKSIACACLTSAYHGFIGEGNSLSEGASRTDKRSDYEHSASPTEYYYDSNTDYDIVRAVDVSCTNSTITYVDYNNYVYNATYADQHMSQTGKLKLITKKIPLTKLDLRESFPMNNNGGEVYLPIVETEVTLPNDFIAALESSTPYFGGRCGDYYYLLANPNGNLSPNGSFKGVKINISTKAVTGFSISNRLDKTMSINNRLIGFGNNTVVIGCTLIGQQYIEDQGFYFQDLTTSADVAWVSTGLNSLSNGAYCKALNYEGYCIIANRKIDFGDRSVLPINGSYSMSNGTNISSDNPLINEYTLYDSGYWRDYFKLYKTTNYLATINNLQTPVVKTSEKTMKVTYILSFDDGE